MKKHIRALLTLGVSLAFIVSMCFTVMVACSTLPNVFNSPDVVVDPPSAFTWEGELDPNDFGNWLPVGIQPSSKDLVWIFMRNPDQTSPIKIVAMSVYKDKTLLVYRYFKHGEPYSYVFNVSKNKYERQHFTQEERKSCIRCHRDKVTPQKEI